MTLVHRVERATTILEKLVAQTLSSLKPGTTICAGRLARDALTAAGFRLLPSTKVLPLLLPVLDKMRQDKRLRFLQQGRVVRQRLDRIHGPLRVAAVLPPKTKPTAPAAPTAPTAPTALARRFDYALDYDKGDFRATPQLYRVGKGEQGVLLVEPYKSEILPLWRFRTEEVAAISAKAIYRKFRQYLKADDFVGMDMARKFLQMGFTRARRYANHAGGRKYSATSGKPLERVTVDQEKAAAAAVFYRYYRLARETPKYQRQLSQHKEAYG